MRCFLYTSIHFVGKCEKDEEGGIVRGTRGGRLKLCLLLMMCINLQNIDCSFVKAL